MKKNKNVIPIFFAVDNGYIPFLAVAIQSLSDHASNKNFYLIKEKIIRINER